ncbi:MAG: hypothetical protein WD555_00220 [Fulvivirga sp.]
MKNLTIDLYLFAPLVLLLLYSFQMKSNGGESGEEQPVMPQHV